MMKKIFLLFLLQVITISSVSAQWNRLTWENVQPFNSVFNNMVSGNFAGTANGVLIIKNAANKEAILDFQGSIAALNIEPDPDEMYDVSYKVYTSATTSGKTQITYTTYATANSLSIIYGGQKYWCGGIDGAADMVIDGLTYNYVLESGAEYLILNFVKTVTLRSEEGKFISIKPNSVIVLIIKR